MADPILLWNEVALEANRVSHTNGQGEQTGPTLSSRALAIVHLAIYDAFAGVVNNPGELPRYTSVMSPAAGASVNEAIAAAALTTLSELFPSQRPFFDSIFEGAGNQPRNSPGHVFGVAVADAIIQDRKNDPGAGGMYKPSPKRGKHRPDPDNPAQGFHAPEYGAKSHGFGITQRFELAPPPFDDDDYRDALKEVRGAGIAQELMGTLPDNIERRTPDQTVVGLYWAYDGSAELGTPPRFYNQVIREVAKAQNNSTTDNARLFAFVNVAMADAGILAWDQKYIHNFWRPVVGIREHDPSFGPEGPAGNEFDDDADPLWLPLGAPNTNRIAKNFTPPFPAYPSGHATFGAAAFHITRLFYGEGGTFADESLDKDELFKDLSSVSEELNGINTDNRGTVRPKHRRNFPDGLWQMIEENGRSRVYLGVHWVFDAFAVKGGNRDPDLYRTVTVENNGNQEERFIGGVPLGLLIAEDVFKNGKNGKGPQPSAVGPRTTTPTPADTTETYSSSYQPAAQTK